MKSIPLALRNHLAQDATTWAFLMKVVCKDGTVLGFTSLDTDVTYNDGGGALLYSGSQGFMPERFVAAADLSVDNTELQGWYDASAISEARIRAGLFNFARVWVYRVNYMSLADGHEIKAAGTLGETRFSDMGWVTEFRSLSQQLKQPIAQLYSLTCRARFGSKPLGTPGAEITERKPCNKDMVWSNGAVTAPGAEADRIFTDSARAEADGHYKPGVIEFLTGDNAGAQVEVIAYAGKQFSLLLPTPYPIKPGDTYRVRQDCDKTPGMCKTRHANYIWFRGEDKTPVASAGSIQTPGANIERTST